MAKKVGKSFSARVKAILQIPQTTNYVVNVQRLNLKSKGWNKVAHVGGEIWYFSRYAC